MHEPHPLTYITRCHFERDELEYTINAIQFLSKTTTRRLTVHAPDKLTSPSHIPSHPLLTTSHPLPLTPSHPHHSSHTPSPRLF